MFVLGLLTVIVVANVPIQAVVGSVAASGALLLVGAASGAGLWAALASRRRAKARPLEPADAIVVMDLESRQLLEADGRPLAGLEHVSVARTTQMTSSARALTIVWPGGHRVVYRGDALLPGGSIAVPAAVLGQRGLPG